MSVRHLGITVCTSNQIGFLLSAASEEELVSVTGHRKEFEPYRGPGGRDGDVEAKIVVEADKVYISAVGAGAELIRFYILQFVCLFLALQPPSGPGSPHSRGF